MGKLRAKLLNKMTGYSPKIIIEIGINGYSYKEAKEEAEEIKDIVVVKLHEYLKQFPNKIYVK